MRPAPKETPPLADTVGNDELLESGALPRHVPSSTTVLVADDDGDLRRAVVEILASEGYQVIEATNGAEALEVLARAADARAELPDVVLLDFVMPGLSGLGVLRLMRRFARAPVTVVMTAFPDPSVETLANSLGAFRVLKKPIHEDVLCDAVEAAARSASRRAAKTGE